MKKMLALLLSAIMALGMVTMVLATAEMPVIGVEIYRYDDTFMTSVRMAIEEAAKDKATLEMTDGQNAQATQNDLIDNHITMGVNALAVNPVDLTAASVILEKAKAAEIPVVFFNREPDAADMPDAGWYYVGAKAEESGTMSGELIADYFKANPEADLNGDGKIQYVILTGQPGHQDAVLRTEYSVKAIEAAGYEVELLATDTANWQRVEAQDKMAAWLAAYDNIEAVLANNDDMALGAIEALKAVGYFVEGKYMPVVGVDATAPALEALKDGTLLGTVLNDAKNQGTATLNLAWALATGAETSIDNVGYEVVEGRYIWVPYQKVTLDNYTEFE